MKGQILYGHFDIEADGPSPATSNMINFGVVFTDYTGAVLAQHTMDIQQRAGFSGDKDTLEWWQADPDRKKEYDRILQCAIPLKQAMESLDKKIATLYLKYGVKRITWVARPASYDWMWFRCYWDIYQQDNPQPTSIGFSATCMSSIRTVWQMFSGHTKETTDAYWKQTFTKNLLFTHNGLDDAMYQAAVFHGMMSELEKYARINI